MEIILNRTVGKKICDGIGLKIKTQEILKISKCLSKDYVWKLPK